MQIQKGFMIFRKGRQGTKPRRIHATIGEAYAEATRLALKAAEEGADDPFLVLEVVGGLRAENGKIVPLFPVSNEEM